MGRKYTFAQLPQWAINKEEVLTKIMRASIQDTLEAMQESAKGVSAGGVRIEGKIPVVSSDLINSQVTDLNGAQVAMGANGYAVALAGFEAGDILRNAWTMQYAFRVEAGFTGTDSLGRTYNQPGWHFVGANAARWPQIVEANVRLYRDT